MYNGNNSSFMNIDNLSIPENDRRILETLALKKEQERESEQFAHQAHLLWEKKRQERQMVEYEQKLKWQKYVQEKRKTESMQNLLRMEEVKQSLRESQRSLEERIIKRDKKVAELKRQQEEKKQIEINERRDQAIRRKEIVDANCKQKQIETELVQQRHQEELTQRLDKAESARSKTQQSIHRRVASANRMEELRHQENMLEVLADKELLLQQKKREIRERQSRARERYSEQIKHRDKHIKESSAEQRLKAMQVKEIHRDLEKGLEQWQDQVMLLQWADSQRAEASVQTQIGNRRLRLEIENKERQLLHVQRMQKVKQAENSKKTIN
uniref:Uncharacterized protein n=1 Tax=Clastoptera arizonana TaxID=38151 RepID=A0A1B6C1E2_9HEMI